MRQLIAVAVVLLVAGATQAAEALPKSEVFIKARLMDLERAPGCGWILFGSPATYEVITGPDELVGREIHVLIDCVEMPRGGTSADRGDLKAFEVGEIHHLALTKENIHGIEVPNALPTDAIWFYLRAASLYELRPNSSLDPLSQLMSDGKHWTLANLSAEIPASYCYDDEPANCKHYGRLYTWAAAQEACRSLGSSWRLPSMEDWKKVARNYGGSLETGQAMARSHIENCWLVGGPVLKCSLEADARTTGTRGLRPMAWERCGVRPDRGWENVRLLGAVCS